MSLIDYSLLAARWLHIAAAIVAIGGAFFTRVALIPAARDLSEAEHAKLRESLRRRWAPVVHTCIVVLLVTGSFNFVMLALPPKIHPVPYHPMFGLKFLAALGVFFIASVLVGRGEGLAKMRAQRAKWLTILLILAGAIVVISGILNRIRTNQAPLASLPPRATQ